MDSDSIIEKWTKRGIKIPLSDWRQSPQKLYFWGLFLLRRSIIKEKVFDEVLLVSDLYWKSPAPKSCCASYLEICEDIRHQSGMKEQYQHRKETIERLFGTAKEYHNLRYTREKGKSKMEDKVGLTLACLNIKKLVKMMVGKTCYFIQIPQYYWIMGELSVNIKKDKHQKRCLSSFWIRILIGILIFFMQIHIKAKGCLIIIY